MKPLIILVVFLLVVMGLVGYMNYKQRETIQELRASIEPVEFGRPQLERFIEIDILGKIRFMPIDDEGKVIDDHIYSGGKK